MGPEKTSDPFMEIAPADSPAPSATLAPSSQNQQQPGAYQPGAYQPAATSGSGNVPQPVDTNAGAAAYVGAQPYSGAYTYGGAYGGGYANNYTNPYGPVSYAQPYNSAYTPYPSYSRAAFVAGATNPPTQYQPAGTTTTLTAAGVRAAGTTMLNSVQEAMARFARVSAMIDDVLRHLHMLFDAIFGLGYTLGAVHAETRLWLAVKTGPVAAITRAVRSVSSIWRLLTLFFLSPMAGRYSPIALVLRILGLVPEHLADNSFPQNQPFQSSEFFQTDENPEYTDPVDNHTNTAQNFRNGASNM